MPSSFIKITVLTLKVWITKQLHNKLALLWGEAQLCLPHVCSKMEASDWSKFVCYTYLAAITTLFKHN